MNELTELGHKRRQYLELTKLFFYEIQTGKTLDELSELKSRIDVLLVEINQLEKDLNISKNNNDLRP